MYTEDKLPLLQKSFTMLTEELTEKDRVSIVTYAGSDEVVLEGASGDDKKAIAEAINSLEANGSTNGSAGIETAYELAEEYFIEGGNNRSCALLPIPLPNGVNMCIADQMNLSFHSLSPSFLSIIQWAATFHKCHYRPRGIK